MERAQTATATGRARRQYQHQQHFHFTQKLTNAITSFTGHFRKQRSMLGYSTQPDEGKTTEIQIHTKGIVPSL